MFSTFRQKLQTLQVLFLGLADFIGEINEKTRECTITLENGETLQAIDMSKAAANAKVEDLVVYKDGDVNIIARANHLRAAYEPAPDIDEDEELTREINAAIDADAAMDEPPVTQTPQSA